MKFIAVILVFILLSISACSPATTQATTQAPTASIQPGGSASPVPSVVANSQSPYPLPTQALAQAPTATLQPGAPGYPEPSVVANPQPPYPMPTVDYTNTSPTPTDDPADGKVRAVILNNGTPVAYTIFFLADVMKDPKTGVEISTSLDRSKAPKAISDKDGKIEFVNVPPGRYGLILLDGTSTYLLVNPDDGKAILLTVTAGSLIDLKQLKFVNLPIN